MCLFLASAQSTPLRFLFITMFLQSVTTAKTSERASEKNKRAVCASWVIYVFQVRWLYISQRNLHTLTRSTLVSDFFLKILFSWLFIYSF